MVYVDRVACCVRGDDVEEVVGEEGNWMLGWKSRTHAYVVGLDAEMFYILACHGTRD